MSVPRKPRKLVSTYSIVAYDPDAQEWGIGVQSKFIAVGAVAPWAAANAGAIATQSYANTAYGPQALSLMAEGISAEDTLQRLLADDPGRELRQVGIVDRHGNAATFTGKDCFDWAGGVTGEGFAAQGNILAGASVVHAMADTYKAAQGSLADRLVASLAAAQAEGGDRRGQQSASLLIVREAGGYGGFNDRFLDLRVDDHPTPIAELGRLLVLFKLYLFKTNPEDLLPIDEAICRELQDILRHFGYYKGDITGVYDAVTKEALSAYSGTENLEERQQDDATIDRIVLEYMRSHRERTPR